jgi:uncharacterized membrane protein YebE (DUF533 family)
MDFFPSIDVSAHEAETIARGLYTIAAVDGVHERELALISEFSRGALDDDLAESTSPLSPGGFGRVVPLDPASVSMLLATEPLRQLFMKAALLVAWADGSVSPAERTKIGEFAQALGVSPSALVALEAEVKDYLLRSLAHLANVDAVAKVAKKLGA